jgi:hypothetical protein
MAIPLSFARRFGLVIAVAGLGLMGTPAARADWHGGGHGGAGWHGGGWGWHGGWHGGGWGWHGGCCWRGGVFIGVPPVYVPPPVYYPPYYPPAYYAPYPYGY